MGFLKDFFYEIFGNIFETSENSNLYPICPNCNTELESFLHQGAIVHNCQKCGGIWLSRSSFETTLDEPEKEAGEIPNEGFMTDHTFSRSTSSRSCPHCNSRMENYQFSYDSGIWIDACPNGHGIWLDPGELEIVRNIHIQMKKPSTPDEKYRLASAFLDGSTKTLQNLSTAEEAIRDEWHRRHSMWSSQTYKF